MIIIEKTKNISSVLVVQERVKDIGEIVLKGENQK
jgi:hypothetical protein